VLSAQQHAALLQHAGAAEQNIEDPLPVAGDKLVCLRNNARRACSTAGCGGEVRAASKSKIITMRLSPDEDFGHKVTKSRCAATVSVRHRDHPVGAAQAYDEFVYGYVLTVHKSQGSPVDDVVLFDESLRSRQPRQVALHRITAARPNG